MKKSILALPVLAIAFALSSCGGADQTQGTTENNSKDKKDYSVTALSPTGDTLWTAVADNLQFTSEVYNYLPENTVSSAGVRVTDKVTGQEFATGTTNYTIKSIPAVTPGK